MVLERTYTIPLRKEWIKAPKYKRAKKAVSAVKIFLKRHMKSDDIKIGKHLNLEIWKHGIKNPPAKIRINAVKDDKNVITAELYGAPIEKKEEKTKKKLKEEKKEEKKVEAPKVKEKKTEVKTEKSKIEEKVEEKPKEEKQKKEVKVEKPKEEKKEAPKEVKEKPVEKEKKELNVKKEGK